MKKLVIFDLDGTLLNTIEDLGHAANYALEKNGFPTHTMASYPFFVGNGVRRLITRVLPEDHRDAPTVDKLLKDFMEHYNDHNCDCTKPYAGIKELLADLQEAGVKLAVASNKYQAATSRIIQHYFGDIDFIAVEGQVEGRNVKPDPSIVFSVLGVAQVPKAEVLYVGDSGVDMETARRACVDSVGVTWGFRPEKELVESYAGRIINNPVEIYNICVEIK
ncbi:MAG: HAD family hydrolase [Bacteroidales bacterium]|nr:HAD family hydrolase [Candidatus Sodaliphilus limicaballi]